MGEQQFDWNYFENEVVIGDRQDKKRMIVIVFSNFMCIPYNRKSFDEIVTLLNEQQSTISALKEENDILKQKLRKNYIANKQYEEKERLKKENRVLKKDLNKLYNLLIDKGMSHNELQDVLW